VTFAAERLVDWRAAVRVGTAVAGSGIPLSPVERAQLFEDFGRFVPDAEGIVRDYSGMPSAEPRARAWVMSRGQWLEANLRGFERAIEPIARKVLADRKVGTTLATVRRNVLGAQLGGLLGYLGRKVLGQYDMFLPPDDDGLLYFVGPNVAGIERKFGFPAQQFRLWICLHEVTHRVQFGTAPWLRGHLSVLMEQYLESMEVDPAWLLQRVRSAVEQVRAGGGDHRGFGWIFLLMTPDQRDLVRRMQSAMSLLEGHANFLMDGVSRDRVPQADLFRQQLHDRRNRGGLEGAFHKAIGFDVKVRQYSQGEEFVRQAVDRVGMERFNRVWDGPDSLPTMDEIADPDGWVSRVAAG
jgi:coenzyme F420 biosynthesis associated uncharacterized protein